MNFVRYFVCAPLFAILLSGATAAYGALIQQCGTASWYALTSQTANGEMANPEAMTAAHPSLPLGTRVRVENLDNGRRLELRINDRGPFIKGRIIDVTRAAADRLGFKDKGITRLRVTALPSARQGRSRACS
jgi:rare lipoprotein A